MKIGIITFWETQDNYGQILQAFALQQVLKQKGHKPYLIRYSLFNDYTSYPGRWKSIFKPTRIFHFIRNKLGLQKNIMRTATVDRQFNQFKQQFLNMSDKIYYSINELTANPPEADIYICGSDQIWYADKNYHIYRNITRAYFLDFGSNSIKRIAYAPSFGRIDYPQEYCDYINPFLKRFQLITVREKGGIEVCKKAGYDQVEQVLDPTLLLQSIDYQNIAVSPSINDKYIFVYLLGTTNHYFDITEIYKYAESQGLKVIYVGSQGNKDKLANVYPTINEWLGMVAKCELMITNSFHGAVFSVIYNKKNIIITPEGKTRSGGNDRIITLFESIGITDRMYNGNIAKIAEKDINYSIVNQKLQSLIEKDINILISNIN